MAASLCQFVELPVFALLSLPFFPSNAYPFHPFSALFFCHWVRGASAGVLVGSKHFAKSAKGSLRLWWHQILASATFFFPFNHQYVGRGVSLLRWWVEMLGWLPFSLNFKCFQWFEMNEWEETSLFSIVMFSLIYIVVVYPSYSLLQLPLYLSLYCCWWRITSSCVLHTFLFI